MTLNKMVPLHAAGEKLLVLLDAPETQSAGGIIIPDTAQKKTVKGVVRSVGPLFDKVEDVPVGATVLLAGEYAGSHIADSGGQALVAVEYEEILAVLE
jgi:chaperonin GroES